MKPWSKPKKTPQRVLGLYRGQIWMAPDFDGPLPPKILEGFCGPPDVTKNAAKNKSAKRKRR